MKIKINDIDIDTHGEVIDKIITDDDWLAVYYTNGYTVVSHRGYEKATETVMTHNEADVILKCEKHEYCYCESEDEREDWR